MKPWHGKKHPVIAALLVVAALCLDSVKSAAQEVKCRATRGSDTSLFVGRCVQGDSIAGDIRLRREANPTHLWIGTIRGARFRSGAMGGAVGESEIGLDGRPGGALRLGRSWLSVWGTHIENDDLRFVFRFDRPEPASDTDVRILETARAMLLDDSQWNRVDTTDMGAAPVKGFSCAPARRQSMFCAVFLASWSIAGDYAHFRPAVNAVREAVHAANKGPYRHPLVEFNNDSSVQLGDVQRVLAMSLAAAQGERARSRECLRQCLDSLAGQYLGALVAHDPSRLLVATGVRFTENGTDLRLGEGLWQSVTGLGAYRVDVTDSETGTVAVQAVVHEGNAVVQLLIRLGVVDRRISEVETVIARKDDTCCWAPERLDGLSPVFEQVLPAADRNTRGEMVAIADGYFTALHTSGTTAYRPARLTRATNRYENGMLTTNVPGGGRLLGQDAATQFDSAMFGPIRVLNRRYLAVDTERGTLLAIVRFESPDPGRRPSIISEFFKIAKGDIQEIRAVMAAGSSSGWR